MSGWLTFWIILVGLGAPLYLYEAFVRPSQQLSHVPPVWRAVPLVMMTTITVVLALSPLGWQSFIVQIGFFSLNAPTFFWQKYIPIKPRELSILGLNKKD